MMRQWNEKSVQSYVMMTDNIAYELYSLLCERVFCMAAFIWLALE